MTFLAIIHADLATQAGRREARQAIAAGISTCAAFGVVCLFIVGAFGK